MSKFSLLNYNQFDMDSDDRFEMLLDGSYSYGKVALGSDFSILLGLDTKGLSGAWYIDNYSKDKAGNFVNGIDAFGNRCSLFVRSRKFGVRPAIKYSEILKDVSKIKYRPGYIEVEYGEYPQTLVSKDMEDMLNIAYMNGLIRQTGKSYMADSVDHTLVDTPFIPKSYVEYELDGQKYIRFVTETDYGQTFLSDGSYIKNNKVYWIKVEPITWLVDENTNIALSEKILFSGVQFSFGLDNDIVNFENSNLKRFMDNYFSKDIVKEDKSSNKSKFDLASEKQKIKVKVREKHS